ncbi:delta(2)-isopentenylpyrophosphate tRNA-adenosine transferase [Wigglesworthia glossinidia endosymbiont of Glossina morsitans morsitans (Yale colony)]|uniref:tRNA dimethylallyltransferase n=1 Tax=Wigglesworthia glossinidia endosymbiont of Glossina morsitans morsitans (Yale colony) TaxID=1142511 RepID=H6Q5D1_WIGGL|nr:tRNA (adenosine(37)-N6)-dimethylallyltransferase MiaA [Wigglesworthia glossinidia]AFA41414.1 delta(2)-isopentenylpyrophosphate tRNA-adenosine transferase [Wigglesworthia glossinidia endosymbiont of Glossina morsitans morsitans (Yale colony)]
MHVTLKLKKYPQAIFLMGPTASGKSEIAEKLKKKLPIEIISVDSACIYRDMNIGTAKPSLSEMGYAPYHLIDICDPSERYSIKDFKNDALKIMHKIISNGRIPLLVGGSMLYFYSLFYGLSPLPPYTPKIRNNLKNKVKKFGWDYIYRKLNNVDPKSSYRIHPNDHQRLIRALEIYIASGFTPTELFNFPKKKFRYDVCQFFILPKKNILHQNIENRFYNMLKNGFQQEVYNLKLRKNLNKNLPSMNCVGYRQMWDYLSGEINYENMVYLTLKATKNLAKKQITWLSKWKKSCYIINTYTSAFAAEKIYDLFKKK